MNTTTKKHPLHVIQHGAVRAAIWEMGSAGRTTFAISLWKLTETSNGWSRSDAFAESEIPSAAAAMLGAHLWVQDQQRKLHRREPGVS